MERRLATSFRNSRGVLKRIIGTAAAPRPHSVCRGGTANDFLGVVGVAACSPFSDFPIFRFHDFPPFPYTAAMGSSDDKSNSPAEPKGAAFTVLNMTRPCSTFTRGQPASLRVNKSG